MDILFIFCMAFERVTIIFLIKVKKSAYKIFLQVKLVSKYPFRVWVVAEWF